MTATPTNTRYEVNLYFEMFYPDFPEWEERLEEGLPDYNLIFLTELSEEASIEEILEDAASRIPDIKRFLNDKDEFIDGIHMEYFDLESEGLYQSLLDGSMTDFFEVENTCGQEEN